MRKFAASLFIAGVVAGGSPRAQDAPNASVITNPDWLKKPTSEQIVGAWPKGALQRGLAGRAELSCRVNAQGLAEACRVVRETPAGEGFGAAALSLTPQFQFRPAMRDGRPVASQITVPIVFKGGPTGGGSSDYTEFSLVQTPIWAAAPMFADLETAYPKSGGGQSAYVAFRCLVKSDGALKDCDVIHANPTGRGFEAAGRGLLKLFRLDVPETTMKPGHELKVDVPIRLVSPTGPELADRVIGQPVWITTVDGPLANLFPAQAAQAGLRTGRGVAECMVAPNGSLEACAPGPADPPGLGFSEIAVAVAKVMRMNRWSGAGGPIDGAHISLPVRFNLKPDAAISSGSAGRIPPS